MAVTFINREARRRASGEQPSPERIQLRRSCGGCDSTYDVNISRGQSISLGITGPGCRACRRTPRSADAAQNSQGRTRRVTKVWWASREGGGPQVRVTTINPNDGSAHAWPRRHSSVLRPEELATAYSGDLVNAAWRARLSALAAGTFGQLSWTALVDSWQADHCYELTILTEILDELNAAVAAAPDADVRMIMRVDALPASLAQLTTDVVGHSPALREGLALSTAAALLRAAGAVACASAGCAPQCPASHVIANSDFTEIDQALFDRSLEILRLEPISYERTQAEAEEHPVRVESNAELESLVAIQRALDAAQGHTPDGPLVFGTLET